MPKPRASAVVKTAVEATKRVPVIPYTQMDCQAFVEYCVNSNDGKMDFTGSNHMYREACTTISPLPEAQSKRLLKPGWLLFIVEPVNERTPVKYRTDGKGDASHVGIYTDYDGVEVAHSSGSRGGVYPSTLKNGWTHCGPAKAMDYEEASSLPAQPDNGLVPPYEAMVDTGSSKIGLNYRMQPSTKAAKIASCPEIPKEALLTVLEHVDAEWARVNYAGVTGYVMREFLRPHTMPAPGPDAGDAHVVTVSDDEIANVVEMIRAEDERHSKKMAEVLETINSWREVYG